MSSGRRWQVVVGGDHRSLPSVSPESRCSTSSRSAGDGDLDVAGRGIDHADRSARSLDQRGIIGSSREITGGYRLPQHINPENLRCLHRNQFRPVQGSGHPSLISDPFDGVGNRGGGDHRVKIRGALESLHGGVDQLRRDQRPGGVMDDDQFGPCILTERGETVGYRFRAGIAAFHDLDSRRAEVTGMARRNGNQNAVDCIGMQERFNRPDIQWPVFQRGQGLGLTGSESLPGTGSHYQCGHPHGRASPARGLRRGGCHRGFIPLFEQAV